MTADGMIELDAPEGVAPGEEPEGGTPPAGPEAEDCAASSMEDAADPSLETDGSQESADAAESDDLQVLDESEEPEEPAEPQSSSPFGSARMPMWFRDRFLGPHTPLTAAICAMVAGQLLVRGLMLKKLFFFQDDFDFQTAAVTHGVGWSYLMQIHTDHLMPGSMLITWIVTRISPLDWGFAAASILLLQLMASLAVLRALVILFGRRPAILVPFAIYLFGAVSISTIGWWAAAVQIIPLQAAFAFAVGSQVLYLRHGGRSHAVAAFAWSAVGLLFIGKAVAIPLVLFGLTVLYFSPAPNLRESFVRAVRQRWRLWTAYVVLLAGYQLFYQARLDANHVTVPLPDSVRQIWTFSWGQVGRTLVPTVFGGPWHWAPEGPYSGLAKPPTALAYLSWLALVALVAVSVRFRTGAGRAWTILTGYILIGDVLPVVLGRLGGTDPFYAPMMGMETRYVADAAPVLAVCLALAFLPLLGESEPYRRTWTLGIRGAGIAGAVATAAVAGLVVSNATFFHMVNADDNRAWATNARAALRGGTAGSSILDTFVPPGVVRAYNGTESLTSNVVAPFATKEQRTDIAAAQPVDLALAFDDQGRLRPVTGLHGGVTAPPGPTPGAGYCLGGTSGSTSSIVTFPVDPTWQHWTVRMDYLVGEPVVVTVRWGLAVQTLHLPAGPHTVSFILAGSTTQLSLTTPASAYDLCVSSLVAGYPTFG